MTKRTHSVILGAGPMGRAIADKQVSKEGTVTMVTRDGRSVGPAVASRRADLSQKEETIAACADADVIYHCAAPPYHQWDTEFPALQDAAIAAAEATGALLVVVENLYGYGCAGILSEDMPLAATTRKGSVRARLSEEILAAHTAGRVRCVLGRAADFFSLDVRMSALGDRFWPAVLSGKTVDWVGDPDAPHSFAYLPDLAAAYVALAETSATWGEAWHLTALPPVRAREICEMARPPDAAPVKLRQTPSWLLRLVGLFQPAAGELVEMRYMFDEAFVTDHTKFDQAVGTQVSGWDKAVAETVNWWQKQTMT